MVFFRLTFTASVVVTAGEVPRQGALDLTVGASDLAVVAVRLVRLGFRPDGGGLRTRSRSTFPADGGNLGRRRRRRTAAEQFPHRQLELGCLRGEPVAARRGRPRRDRGTSLTERVPTRGLALRRRHGQVLRLQPSLRRRGRLLVVQRGLRLAGAVPPPSRRPPIWQTKRKSFFPHSAVMKEIMKIFF